MEALQEFFKLDFSSIFIGIFIISLAFIAVCDVATRLYTIFKKPIHKIQESDHDHELLLNAIQTLSDLQKTHTEDMEKSDNQDKLIKQDLHALTISVNEISDKLNELQRKIDYTEMVKLKDKLLHYYRKYKDVGEWEQFEADTFWGLYDSYISHGGNSFVRDVISPAMRELRIKNDE